MTKFELPSFNSGANSKSYRDNYDSVFGKKKKAPKKDDEPSKEPEIEQQEYTDDDAPKDDKGKKG